MISLSEARKTNRLPEFIADQEAKGIGPINRAEFDALASTMVKAPQLEGRTSRSASGGNSSETKTRRDSGQGASD